MRDERETRDYATGLWLFVAAPGAWSEEEEVTTDCVARALRVTPDNLLV
jgi:hypothetical protein